MTYLNFSKEPPRPTITVERGGSSLRRPITSVSARVAAKRQAVLDKTSHDTSTLSLISWNTIHSTLLKLNPRMLFRPYGDGRVVIGVDRPSPEAIAAYDELSYYDKKETDSYKETPGPRVWIIMAPSNSVSPYVELRSSTPPHPPIARCLLSIIRACVRERAFTWQAAEKAFRMPFEHAHRDVRFMPYTAKSWSARTDAQIVLNSPQPACQAEKGALLGS